MSDTRNVTKTKLDFARKIVSAVIVGILLQCGAWFAAALLIGCGYTSLVDAGDLLMSSPLLTIFLVGFLPYVLALAETIAFFRAKP